MPTAAPGPAGPAGRAGHAGRAATGCRGLRGLGLAFGPSASLRAFGRAWPRRLPLGNRLSASRWPCTNTSVSFLPGSPGAVSVGADEGVGAEKRRGRCKWFNVAKGWGFISPDDGGQDIFVHQVSVVVRDVVRSHHPRPELGRSGQARFLETPDRCCGCVRCQSLLDRRTHFKTDWVIPPKPRPTTGPFPREREARLDSPRSWPPTRKCRSLDRAASPRVQSRLEASAFVILPRSCDVIVSKPPLHFLVLNLETRELRNI